MLFANAPWHKWEGGRVIYRGVRAGSRWPHTIPCYGSDMIGDYLPFPFFLATGAALVRQAGFEACLRDSIGLGESYEDFYAYVREQSPDVIAMETSTPSLRNDLEVAAELKRILPDVRILFCGVHHEMDSEAFLARHSVIDYCVYGEYETPVLRLLEALRDGESLASVNNLVYREQDSVRKTAPGPLVDLNRFPWPVRDEMPVRNYFDSVCGLERPQLQIITTRGCPYGCIFCVWPQLIYRGNRYRTRSPQDVVDEIAYHVSKYPYKSFYIDDDTFNIRPDHVLEIARLLRERQLDHIPWGIMARADRMTEEILRSLRDAGLYSVKYGVESADQQTLDNIGKGMSVEQVRHIIEYTKSLGIKVHLTFTFGLPDDTPESIEKTITLAAELPSDSVQFSIATPFPGTKMYEIYKDKGWLTTQDWSRYDGAATAVSRTERFSGEQLEGFVREAYQRYNEARIRVALRTEDFLTALRRRLMEEVPEGAALLMPQAANITLTTTLATILSRWGYQVHLFSHVRFAELFADILPKEQLHLFAEPNDFRFALLREQAEQLGVAATFAAAVIPYSNLTGCGYEEVEQLALAAAPKIAAGVNLHGQIIK
ncbi:B12-binding domain-containing radical SAM protein [Heliobacterium mobile]|uniref:B12-binding domain-containing radical SAM protein n=1 Tax=Heliobacterium mobile TaxID=28064 RepID=UPI002E25E7B7|nr:radical SAM protein [Heliobacterium mobile]